MTSRQKSRAKATINKQLGFRRESSGRLSLEPLGHFSRTRSDKLMRDGLQEIGEVILGWLSEPAQKLMDFFHIARGSAKVVKAIEREN
jgi:hypothetical protein